MQHPIIPRRVIVWLSIGAFFLPIVLCVTLGVSTLLSSMGDAAGGGVLARIALAFGLIWAIDLISLVLTLSLRALNETSNDEEPTDLGRP